MLVDKLQVIEDKFMDLEQRISDPEVIARQDEWRKLTRQHAQLSETVETFRTYKKVLSGIDEAMEVIEDKSMDEEFREMAQEELKELKPQKEELEEKLQVLLLPKDPNDDKNIIIEIRGGAGGDEAALFAGDLFRMYTKYAESQGWRCEIIDANEPELGGFKEVIFSVDGENVYSIFVFAFLGWPNLLERIVSRVLLMPVVAGIAYEVIRLAGRSDHSFVKALIKPGLALQYMTTREPEDDQIEVAIRALEEVRPPESDAYEEE